MNDLTKSIPHGLDYHHFYSSQQTQVVCILVPVQLDVLQILDLRVQLQSFLKCHQGEECRWKRVFV